MTTPSRPVAAAEAPSDGVPTAAPAPLTPTATTTSRPRAGRPSMGARLRYRFDNALARGPMVVIAYLGLLSLAIVLVAAIVATAASFTFGGASEDSFAEDVWQAMLRMVDAGTFAGDAAWPTRLLALAVTVIGIFLAGSLIGLIANAVDQRVEELRRGQNTVIETGHTLILGWSAQVPRIVGELVIANESERDAAVVVLADADKTEMEETLRQRVPDLRTTRVVCRSGNPALPDDLTRCAIEAARSIVVVRSDDGDAGVVKAVLAARALDPDLATAPVVAEVEEADAARALRAVGAGRVVTVSSDDVVAEVTAQACLRSGLTAVFTDLLDFDGDEIYFTTVPELTGRRYADALLAFERCSVIGVAGADGAVALNPAPDTILGPRHEVVVVAADDSAVAFTGFEATAPAATLLDDVPATGPVRIAMVGWSGFGAKVLKELDEFLPSGSTVEVLVDADLADPAGIDPGGLVNAEVEVRAATDAHAAIESLAAARPPDQVIVLGYRDALSVDDADARTLLTLLALRQIFPADDPDHVRIVAELLDQRNLVLADPVGVDDLIVSDAVASLLIAQLAERAALDAVFRDLFDPDGAVLDLLPAGVFAPAEPVTWGAVVARGAARRASVLGYRTAAGGEVTLNPPKTAVVHLGPGDQVIAVITR